MRAHKHPRPVSPTPTGSKFQQSHNASTQDNTSCYNMQGSLEEYNYLMRQNQWLKKEIQKKYRNLLQEAQARNICNTETNASSEMACRHNQWVGRKLVKDRSCCDLGRNVVYDYGQKQNMTNGGDDIILSELIRRNKYLEQKNMQLKHQQLRQLYNISKAQSKQQQKISQNCCQSTTKCFHRKYMQLLRVKSPLL